MLHVKGNKKRNIKKKKRHLDILLNAIGWFKFLSSWLVDGYSVYENLIVHIAITNHIRSSCKTKSLANVRKCFRRAPSRCASSNAKPEGGDVSLMSIISGFLDGLKKRVNNNNHNRINTWTSNYQPETNFRKYITSLCSVWFLNGLNN